MCTLVEKLLKCCNHFLKLSEFPALSGKVYLITFKFSYLDCLKMFRKSNVNKIVYLFLVLLNYGEILTVKSEKKVALTQFVIFKHLSSCFEETIGFDEKASFASRPVSRLIS